MSLLALTRHFRSKFLAVILADQLWNHSVDSFLNRKVFHLDLMRHQRHLSIMWNVLTSPEVQKIMNEE